MLSDFKYFPSCEYMKAENSPETLDLSVRTYSTFIEPPVGAAKFDLPII